MAYTVIARRWRPQTLDQVVGQRHVTQTLRNAFTLCDASGSKRIAQAFVFAGPRGVGKTTTARILARVFSPLPYVLRDAATYGPRSHGQTVPWW